MNKYIALLFVVAASSVVASAETLLNVTLTPAFDWHSTGCSNANTLFLRATTPGPVQNDGCSQICAADQTCGGSFVADFR